MGVAPPRLLGRLDRQPLRRHGGRGHPRAGAGEARPGARLAGPAHARDVATSQREARRAFALPRAPSRKGQRANWRQKRPAGFSAALGPIGETWGGRTRRRGRGRPRRTSA
nr:MAG TPA: hypothetical protein [Caudoviricetes sp.]